MQAVFALLNVAIDSVQILSKYKYLVMVRL